MAEPEEAEQPRGEQKSCAKQPWPCGAGLGDIDGSGTIYSADSADVEGRER